MIKIKVNQQPLLNAVDRYMRDSKRSRERVMRVQAKSILRYVIGLTPPGGYNKSTDEMLTGKKAQTQGMQAVESDIRKVLRASSSPKAELDAAPFHNRYRASGGRVYTNLKKGKGKDDKRIKVVTSTLNAYIKKKKAMVGYLASGWAKGASDLKIALPAWIKKNKAPSDCRITGSKSGISIRITNNAPFAGAVKDFQRHVNAAIRNQTNNVLKQVRDYEKKLQKESGLKVT